MNHLVSRCFMIVCLALLVVALGGCDARSGVGESRFSRSDDGVITDSVTNLQWLPGSDKDVNYHQAGQWVASVAANGNWRMPTREELKTLYEPACQYHIDPLFKATAMRWVWAESRDSSSAWLFNFNGGPDGWSTLDGSANRRVFAVRPQK